MTSKEYKEKLAELLKKQAELDEIYYDESDPCAFDGDCIAQLHQLADEALALADGYILNEEEERGGRVMTMGSYDREWQDRPLEVRFDLFQKLTKQGWRIQIEEIDQVENGYWHIDEETGLPYPNQIINADASVPLKTYTTYVYEPGSDEYVLTKTIGTDDDLIASFDSPLEAYEWLAPRLDKYAKKWRKNNDN